MHLCVYVYPFSSGCTHLLSHRFGLLFGLERKKEEEKTDFCKFQILPQRFERNKAGKNVHCKPPCPFVLPRVYTNSQKTYLTCNLFLPLERLSILRRRRGIDTIALNSENDSSLTHGNGAYDMRSFDDEEALEVYMDPDLETGAHNSQLHDDVESRRLDHTERTGFAKSSSSSSSFGVTGSKQQQAQKKKDRRHQFEDSSSSEEEEEDEEEHVAFLAGNDSNHVDEPALLPDHDRLLGIDLNLDEALGPDPLEEHASHHDKKNNEDNATNRKKTVIEQQQQQQQENREKQEKEEEEQHTSIVVTGVEDGDDSFGEESDSQDSGEELVGKVFGLGSATETYRGKKRRSRKKREGSEVRQKSHTVTPSIELDDDAALDLFDYIGDDDADTTVTTESLVAEYSKDNQQDAVMLIPTVEKDIYFYGTRKIHLKVVNGDLRVRVGGGWAPISDFAKKNRAGEQRKLRSRRLSGDFTDIVPQQLRVSNKGRSSPSTSSQSSFSTPSNKTGGRKKPLSASGTGSAPSGSKTQELEDWSDQDDEQAHPESPQKGVDNAPLIAALFDMDEIPDDDEDTEVALQRIEREKEAKQRAANPQTFSPVSPVYAGDIDTLSDDNVEDEKEEEEEVTTEAKPAPIEAESVGVTQDTQEEEEEDVEEEEDATENVNRPMRSEHDEDVSRRASIKGVIDAKEFEDAFPDDDASSTGTHTRADSHSDASLSGLQTSTRSLLSVDEVVDDSDEEETGVEAKKEEEELFAVPIPEHESTETASAVAPLTEQDEVKEAEEEVVEETKDEPDHMPAVHDEPEATGSAEVATLTAEPVAVEVDQEENQESDQEEEQGQEQAQASEEVEEEEEEEEEVEEPSAVAENPIAVHEEDEQEDINDEDVPEVLPTEKKAVIPESLVPPELVNEALPGAIMRLGDEEGGDEDEEDRGDFFLGYDQGEGADDDLADDILGMSEDDDEAAIEELKARARERQS